MSSQPIVASAEELASRWTSFASSYEKFVEPTTLNLNYAMLNALHLESAENILEIASGPGSGAVEIARVVQSRHWLAAEKSLSSTAATTKSSRRVVRVVATDIAPGMVQLAKARLVSWAKQQQTLLAAEEEEAKATSATTTTATATAAAPASTAASSSSSSQPDASVVSASGALQVDLYTGLANGEDASAYGSASFDRVIASLCLQITPDANAMLREVHRLLAPNGVAAFSIWGKKELSPMFTLIPQTYQRLRTAAQGVFAASASSSTAATAEPPQPRSNFYLGQDDGALRKRFVEAGFKQIVIWHQQSVMEAVNPEDFFPRFIATPGNAAMVKSLTSAQYDELQKEVTKAAAALLEQGTPIGMDAIIIIARK